MHPVDASIIPEFKQRHPRVAAVIYRYHKGISESFLSTTEQKAEVPNFNSKEMSCIVCGKKMFYSPENLVHVCLEDTHGVLCFFEPDSCWFAASEKTSLELAKKGIKFHFIPKQVFENANLQLDFNCEYGKSAAGSATSPENHGR